MGNHHHRFAAREPFERQLHLVFVFGVGKCRRFVQNYDGRVFEYRAGDCNPLLLSSRKICALAAYDRPDTFGKFCDYVFALRRFQRAQNFFVGRVGTRKTHVFGNSGFEQSVVLKHICHAVRQRFLVYVPDVYAAEKYLPLRRIPEACDESRNRSLSSAALAHECHAAAAVDNERYAVHRVGFRGRIAEMHVAEFDTVTGRTARFFGFGKRLHIQHGIYAVHCVVHHHLVFARIHYSVEHNGKQRRKDDVEQQIREKRGGDGVASHYYQRRAEQKGERTVNEQRKKHHRLPQLFGVSHGPDVVALYRIFEACKRINRLPECLDDGHSPHIFHRFVVHIGKRVVVLSHLFGKPAANHPRV